MQFGSINKKAAEPLAFASAMGGWGSGSAGYFGRLS